MSMFALVDAQDTVLRTELFQVQPPDPVGKNWRWLPLVVQTGDVAGYSVQPTQVVQTIVNEVVVPVVTMRQARLALLGANLLDSVTAAIAAADDVTKIYWDTSPTVARDNSVVLALATALGLSDAQVDALFAAAAQLT